ncbi:MAG: hypothetical protein P0Y64_01620 [Candidatus Sphingomonas colombiensis]|nr:hypothetical protein [Sphingomonas sp.]WEK43557.1 MAG: hypothetical protein P0Y64_01620 [Sphingomonas sp.]
MTFQQLDPPIPLHVLGKGTGFAIAVIDYGQEHNLIWVTALDDSGEIWCAPNPQVRMQANWTMGRSKPFGAARGVGDCSAKTGAGENAESEPPN